MFIYFCFVIVLMGFFILLMGLVYLLVMIGVVKVLFFVVVNGSLIEMEDVVIGLFLIVQFFVGVGYLYLCFLVSGWNVVGMGVLNFGFIFVVLIVIVVECCVVWEIVNEVIVFIDVVIVFGFGFDFYISLENVLVQVVWIVVVCGVDEGVVWVVIVVVIEGLFFGFYGEFWVNVFVINIVFDEVFLILFVGEGG